MSDARLHRPASAPRTREGIRVRHRHTRREGRISAEPAELGFVRVLFDGEARSKCVSASAVEDLDADGSTRS